MGKTVCVCGAESVLRANIIRSLVERDYRILVTESEKFSEEQEQDERLKYYQIHTFSSIRVRSMFMKAIRDFEALDEVILVHTPLGDHSPIHEVPAVTIENTVDAAIKGYMYIAKEALAYFTKKQQGTFTFVVAGQHEAISSLDAVLSGGFRSLADSLFRMYQNEPVNIIGFETTETQPEGYAEFIVRTLTEKEKQSKGRWIPYTDRQGLFQSLNITRLGK
jgi:NAD(P)-dependent dehydrogenase (short-subunit alcohol dehydrogenase family)